MWFGRLKVGEAEGAILAHTVLHAGGTIKKGQVISRTLVEELLSAGVESVYAARLDGHDVRENEIAQRLGEKLIGNHASLSQAATGRANIFSDAHGLAILNAERLCELNHLDESITIATLPLFMPVEQGDRLATIKIIPFAVADTLVDRALEICTDTGPLIEVAPFARKAAGLVLTTTPYTKKRTLDKSYRVLDQRLGALGTEITWSVVTPHEEEAVANALKGLREEQLSPILVLGAAAISDRSDVIPAGLARAGGVVEHLGMPVEPGNLLMLGRLGDTPVIGVPSCARSPKLNGFDWVLQRLLADQPVTTTDIMAMGVGGLLTRA